MKQKQVRVGNLKKYKNYIYTSNRRKSTTNFLESQKKKFFKKDLRQSSQKIF